MQTQDITTTAAEISTIDQSINDGAVKCAAIIRALLAECAASIKRAEWRPTLQQDADGNGQEAEWLGISFAGRQSRHHCGQGGRTWQWVLGGQTAYITRGGYVHLVDWDGEGTDFSQKGYMDRFRSDVTIQDLVTHLEANPESAQEIVDAIRKIVAEDKLAAKGRLQKMTEIIAALK